ncbi:hypothetical protein [aff. Roholtiella sp. LEGE 12411]|uniref:hypothetical protein n=1 Tax=aff. Roholtiella sp. LEGE 12411 TaxID=1828822 RepID=UPI0030DD73CB
MGNKPKKILEKQFKKAIFPKFLGLTHYTNRALYALSEFGRSRLLTITATWMAIAKRQLKDHVFTPETHPLYL